ncbi:MAG TPA: D-glycerate dehydrogenase [Acidimicrobiia bacterium]|nr:D-glycerate dehydrogenase [Acidimicrobiia bacterium]
MFRYVVTAPLPDEVEAHLPAGDRWQEPGPEPMDPGRLAALIGEIEGLLCSIPDRIDRGLLEGARNLRVISQLAVGLDNLDLAACTELRIPVGHTPGVLTDTTADTAIALLLASVRRLPEGERLVRNGGWERWSSDLLLGADLHHSTVGIVGLGRIGSAIARRLRGFDCRLLYTGPNRKVSAEETLGVSYLQLPDLLRSADHVILSAPLRSETRQLIGRAELKLMKPTATLVNIARGPLIDPEALADALATGEIARAALDVTDPEPIPPDHRLVLMDNCLIIPHLGSASHATRKAMAQMAVDNLAAGLAGERLPACANPEVYDSS